MLQRARLLARLEEGLHLPLTLVSAPAGYGKSTMASQWMATCDLPSGWISLDVADGDLRTFLGYLIAALQSVFPDSEWRTADLLEVAKLPPVPEVARRLLGDLDRTEGHFALVLDDYHRIDARSAVNHLIEELLAHAPDSAHFVLLTRRDPALPIAAMRGAGRMSEIRAADLRFTPREATDFLRDKLGLGIEEADAVSLQVKTEGWATGIRLAALYLQGQTDLAGRIREIHGTSRHIADYLFSEVLERQTPGVADTLLRTSILDRFCAPLAAAVAGRIVEPEAFVEQLVRTNLFVVALDGEGFWFRYHHLFQEFLQAKLHRSADAETIAGLHRSASEWFEAEDLTNEAIGHALAAGDTDTAVELLLKHRHEQLNLRHFAALAQWLDMLPEEVVAGHPLLMTTRAILSFFWGLPVDPFACVLAAQRLARTLPAGSPEARSLRGEISALWSVQSLMSGRPAETSTHARESFDQLPHEALHFRSLAVAAAAGGRQGQGDYAAGVAMLREALLDPAWPEHQSDLLWLYLCYVGFLEADSDGVLFAGREGLRVGRSSPYSWTRQNARYLLGAVHYLRDELEDAETCLLELMSHREQTEDLTLAQAAGILGFIHLSGAGTEETGRIHNEVAAGLWKVRDPFAEVTLRGLRVEFALRHGDLDQARRLSRHVNFQLRPPHWEFYVPVLTPIRLRIAEGTPAGLREARDLLLDLDERMRDIHRHKVRVDVRILLALAFHGLGDEPAALESMETALALAEPGRWVRNFIHPCAPAIQGLLRRLGGSESEGTHLRRVLDASVAEAARSGRPRSRVLTPREVEILELVAEGLSNKQIAARLGITTETVKRHLQNVYRKLGVHGRIAALEGARARDLIPSS